MTLNRPEAVYFLPLIFGLLILLAWRRRHFLGFSRMTFLSAEVHKATLGDRLPAAAAGLGLVCLGAALLDPVRTNVAREVKHEGLDIVLVVDLSSSMQEKMGLTELRANYATAWREGRRPGGTSMANVAQLPTRLETVKAVVRQFIGRRPKDRMGLVAFSENAYVVSPLTTDHEYLQQYVEILDDRILIGEGLTAIGEGMAAGYNILLRQSRDLKRNKVLVVLTDGENNFGRDPVQTASLAIELGYRVYLIGVDLEERVQQRIEPLVQMIKSTGGSYYDATSAADLSRAYHSIATTEKGIYTHRELVALEPVFHYFALGSLVLILLSLSLRLLPFFRSIT
ncbi:MAG: VWA domain-containing protein [Acidobacteria bacterium]|nr:VWA domain-containing protein [Acidobacteriota bacterium]